ncbi:unnamed protein product [Macrosiphum euphorbiae]|uniref:Uncharacterized protein n=1 Tax=Macrosiphum euphorbiae TaxID=13131 RepID=A0AAV0W5N6_9HEMI|nr:unnamed protein product [Macrosiphum euphorbiae]
MYLDTSGQQQTSEWHPPSGGRSESVGGARLPCSGGAAVHLQQLQQARLFPGGRRSMTAARATSFDSGSSVLGLWYAHVDRIPYDAHL